MPPPGFPAGWGLSAHLKEIPASNITELLQLFPLWFRDGDSTLRDNMATALVKAFALQASDVAAFVATSADPNYASGTALDFLGGPIVRADGETPDAYRQRILDNEDICTPTAIMAAIKRIIAPFTTKDPYYTERPDDDIFLFRRSGPQGLAERGFYINGKRPIRKATRRYADRPYSEPKTGFWFRSRRNNVEARSTSTGTGLAPSVRSLLGDDTTAPDNAYGHALIGIPAFPLPWRRGPSDLIGRRGFAGTVPMTDVSGALTAAATKAAGQMATLFRRATVATKVGAGKRSGPSIYHSDRDPARVVSQIQALLRSRAMFPSQFTIVLDPAIT